jgi:hypothetical protein
MLRLFLVFSPKKWQKNSVLAQNKAKLCKYLIRTLVYEKRPIFCSEKLSKIAENCHHNIGP